MKKRILFITCLVTCLLLLVGCSCEHIWIEADCANAKTCIECHITEGKPLGHTPGEWCEIADVGTATVSRVQYCTVCNEPTASETAPLSTMIQDGLFLFTPNGFMERLAAIADKHIDGFTYEFVPSNTGLQAFVFCNEKQSIVQFFRSDATILATDDIDVAEIWCVSLISIGESDANLRLSFFMACDPTLDKDSAFDVDLASSTAFLNSATRGESFGYYQHNKLLYETSYISEGDLGQAYSMNLVNIYASDFRQGNDGMPTN